MRVSLYLIAQEQHNVLGNSGPLTEVTGSSVTNSVELRKLEPPIIQSVVSFSITEAACDLGSFILMDVLACPNTMHDGFEFIPPQRIGASLMSPPIAYLLTDSNSPKADVQVRLESVRSMTSVCF